MLSVTPGSINLSAGKVVTVTVAGTGFVSGATVKLESGEGPVPTARVTSVSATAITVVLTFKDGGPTRSRYWDVRVTNPNGATSVLPRGFSVNP
jgi:hypothetical protein